MRPEPLSPQARKPLSGPITCTPRSRSTAIFLRVASASHMFTFMAGATRMGARVASAVVESISSASPHASLARIFAVAGAMQNSSARFASATCSTSQRSGRSKVSVTTGLADMVSKVSGATNCVAFFVMMT